MAMVRGGPQVRPVSLTETYCYPAIVNTKQATAKQSNSERGLGFISTFRFYVSHVWLVSLVFGSHPPSIIYVY